MSWQAEIEELERRKAQGQVMGGPDKIKRQHDAGKLTAPWPASNAPFKMFAASELFPPQVSAAITVIWPFCKPPVSRSKSAKPVGTPVNPGCEASSS